MQGWSDLLRPPLAERYSTAFCQERIDAAYDMIRREMTERLYT
jgi:hypothetical protein